MKMCVWSLEFWDCIKAVQRCGTVRKRSSAFSDDVMENGWGGGEGLFFLVATKKQEVIGGKQWDLVGVGEKKAEDWAKPSVKLH